MHFHKQATKHNLFIKAACLREDLSGCRRTKCSPRPFGKSVEHFQRSSQLVWIMAHKYNSTLVWNLTHWGTFHNLLGNTGGFSNDSRHMNHCGEKVTKRRREGEMWVSTSCPHICPQEQAGFSSAWIYLAVWPTAAMTVSLLWWIACFVSCDKLCFFNLIL